MQKQLEKSSGATCNSQKKKANLVLWRCTYKNEPYKRERDLRECREKEKWEHFGLSTLLEKAIKQSLKSIWKPIYLLWGKK